LERSTGEKRNQGAEQIKGERDEDSKGEQGALKKKSEESKNVVQQLVSGRSLYSKTKRGKGVRRSASSTTG